ncbi:MAG: dienelactone hydrolase family protein [Actinomycetota bacterium]|nr:dienelactone hydrolase family protein [Actinomycetota bacterium]
MSILPGEGKHLIVYGSLRLPSGTQMHEGYLARPDVVGSFPTVLVAHDIFGLTSHERQVCRQLARHGLVAVAIDLYRGAGPPRRSTLEQALELYHRLPDGRALADLHDAYEFITNEDIESTHKEGPGILGLDVGGRLALLYAADHAALQAIAVCYAPLSGELTRYRTAQPLDVLADVRAPILGLYGQDDDLISGRDVTEAQRKTPYGEWVLYEGVGHDFFNDTRPGYDEGAAEDALQRLVAFFTANLPTAEIVPVG